MLSDYCSKCGKNTETYATQITGSGEYWLKLLRCKLCNHTKWRKHGYFDGEGERQTSDWVIRKEIDCETNI